MDMLKGDEIADAKLTDWRKLAQGLHARYPVDGFGTGAWLSAAVGEAGDALGHHLPGGLARVAAGNGQLVRRTGAGITAAGDAKVAASAGGGRR